MFTCSLTVNFYFISFTAAQQSFTGGRLQSTWYVQNTKDKKSSLYFVFPMLQLGLKLCTHRICWNHF